MWDLTTALELKLTNNSDYNSSYNSSTQQQQSYQQYGQQPRDLTMYGLGGPTPSEFAKLLDRIELASTNSGYSTPTTNNCFSPCGCGSGGGGGIGVGVNMNSTGSNNISNNNVYNNTNVNNINGFASGLSKYANNNNNNNKNLLMNSDACGNTNPTN